ncbi:S8 family serine peptidase [Paenibacillus alvei]|uniref:S8 family serine peptidase n=1 Tax=Paenibacillus alvei TaxID=44250 RepID=UPI0013DB4E2E|nr:S8 family serine peptidase [Paenibacillus alvei]NEZ41083.1 S8 family serine peptidase [Paenibacillus alvei]
MQAKSWFKSWIASLLVFILIFSSPAFTYAAHRDASDSISAMSANLSMDDNASYPNSKQLGGDRVKIDTKLLQVFQADKYATYIIKLKEQPDIKAISQNALQWSLQKGESSAKQTRTVRNFIVNSLMSTADESQAGIIQQLEKMESTGEVRDFYPYYIVNAIAVTSTKEAMEKLADRDEVDKIMSNHTYTLQTNTKSKMVLSGAQLAVSKKEIPWNLRNINAEQAWELGFDGTGVVVANMDSGVDGSHPALQHKWRGLDQGGNIVDPELSWFDATIEKKKFPTDGNGHGTHVMGTMVGSEKDGSNKIGVASNAKWIAARVFDSNGQTTDADLIKAGEWILAPTDKHGVKHPELAPDVVNNSWGNVPAGKNEFFHDIVKAWIAADIFPAFSAGNAQPPENNGGPGSITAPGNYPESFATGAVDIQNKLADFSLQGPTPYGQMKPEVSAPGVHIRSAVPGGQYALMNGTSMASPHTAGVAALIKQANRSLKVKDIEEILKNTTDALTDHVFPQSPNNGYGWGVINALNAVSTQDKGLGKVVGQVTVDGISAGIPTIEHDPITLTFNILDKDVFARVQDDVSVTNVNLYVREKGTNAWSKHAMLRTSGSHISGLYEGSIPLKELSLNGIEYYIEAVNFSGHASKTEVYPVTVSKGVKIGYTQDFETSIDGFGFGDASGVWQWGVPTSGPKQAFSGSRVMATVLDGKYPNGTNSYVEMPVIDLTDKQHAVLSFAHWYKLGDWWNASYDRAEVFIGSKKSNFQFERVKTYTMRNTTWTTEYIDLSPYAGDQIYVVFNLRGEFGSDEGWYIDDIKIRAPDPTLPLPPKIKVRSNAPGKVIIDFDDAPSGVLKEYVIYRSTDRSGPWSEIGTSSGYNYADLPSPQKGTYYYKVKSRTVSHALSVDSDIVSWTFTEGQVIFGDDFEGANKGWTVEGQGNEWEHGVPHPTRGPQKAVSGQNVWGTNLNGPYGGDVNQSLVSPEIDLTQMKHASLYFQQWHDIDDGDKGTVEISKDQGATWQPLAEYPKQGYDTNHPRRFWYLEELGLDSYIGEKINIRFRFESKRPSLQLGWYIDDVEVRETPPVMTRPKTTTYSHTGGDQVKNASMGMEKQSLDVLTFEMLKSAKRGQDAQQGGHTQAFAQQPNAGRMPIMADISVVQSQRATRSDAGTGRYTLKHPPGDYLLQVEAYGFKTEQRPISIEQNKEAVMDVHLQPLAKGKIAGKITDFATGMPLKNATIRLLNDVRIAPVLTNQEGQFELEAYEGDYQLSVSVLNYLSVQDNVKITGNDTVNVSFALHGFHGSSEEIHYDDGVADNAKAFYDSGNGFAVRMTTDGPAQVTGAKFFFWDQGWPNPGGEKFKYAIYDASGPDGLPGKVVAGPYEGKAKRNGSWTNVTIQNPVIFNGDFYVAYIQEGEMPNVPGLSMTKLGNYSGRSWKNDRGTWKKIGNSDGNYMIRAAVTKIAEEPIITEPAPGTTVTDAHVVVKGMYPTDGTTIHVYRQDARIGTGVVQQGQFAIPVQLERGENKLYAVAESNGQATSKSPTIAIHYTAPAQNGEITSITVQPRDVSLKTGEQSTLTVTAAVYENGNMIPMPLTEGLRFTSSDSSIAEVDQAGHVTGVSEGTSVVRVTYQQWSDQSTITVHRGNDGKEPELQSITVYPDKLSLDVGESAPLSVAAVVYRDGEVKISPITKHLQFRSSDEHVAKVDDIGSVTGWNEGRATITVFYKDKQTEAVVTVRKKSVIPYEPPASSGGSSSSGNSGTTVPEKDKRIPVVADGKTIGYLVEQSDFTSLTKNASVSLLAQWMNDELKGAVNKPVMMDLRNVDFKNYAQVSITFQATMMKQLQISGKALHIASGGFELTIPNKAISDYLSNDQFKLNVSVQGADQLMVAENDQGRLVSDRVAISTESGKFIHPVTLLLRWDKTQVKDSRKTVVYRKSTDEKWIYADRSSRYPYGLALTISQSGAYAVHELSPSFTDLAAHWGRDAIEVLAAQHIVNGTSKGLYTPNATITRAQFLIMLDRLTPSLEGHEGNANSDRLHWATGNVNELISRAEMVRLLVQKSAADVRHAMKSRFTDTSHLSQDEQAAIAHAVDQGWVQGIGGNRFGSDLTSTRAQAAMLLYRYMKSMNQL